MKTLGFALMILWGFVISSSILGVLIMDSDDCSIFENGWDKICDEQKELHKANLLRIMSIAGIIFSVLFIIVIPRNVSENEK